MSEFAIWPPRDAPVSAATLAREMMALTQATLSPPPFPEDAARGDGQPVIVIPGFLAPDMSTTRLREFLARQNFMPYSWTVGLNLGPMRKVMREVERQASIPAASDMVEVVEISGAHMAICSNPQAQRIIADRLAKTVG